MKQSVTRRAEIKTNSLWSMDFKNDSAALHLTSEFVYLSSPIMAGIPALIASWKGARMHSQSSVGIDAEELTPVDKFAKQVGSCGSDIGTVVAEKCNDGGHLILDSLVEWC